MRKKLLLVILSVLTVFTLFACKKENTAPELAGVANTAIAYGVEFDPLAGVTAYDQEDGNLTDQITVTGTVNHFVAADYTLRYRVEDSEGLFAEATRVVTVNPLTEAVLANGWYDYKFATADVKHTFFAAAEKWLLENGYAGIPMAAQSGLTIQHDRIVLPVEDYIPSFGWGTSYATLTKDDAEVAAENGGQLDLLQTPAVEGKYTYRTWMQLEPDTLNYYQGQSSTESDYGSYINGALYEMALNETATGWVFVPSLASGEPVPVNGEVINGKMTAKIWEIPLRDNLEWAYNAATDTSAFPEGHEKLDAHDFVYSYRLALDNEWFRATQGGGDFISSKVKGAEAYAAGVAEGKSKAELDALWAGFGITASEDGLTLRVEFTEPYSAFNIKYSFGMPPVSQAVYESNPELYGTSPEFIGVSGKFTISYWEDGVGSRYEKNMKHPRASATQWTGESVKILPGSSAIDQAFEAFEQGLLESAGIPNSRVKEFAEDPRVLRTPGATVWSLNINMVGSVQAQQAQWPGSTYVPEPILANKDFRLALYFSMNRDDMVQYDVKTYPTSMKISQAYYVDPESGVPYRSTPQGMAVGENLAYSTNGYDPEAAQELFKRAVAAEIAAGNYQKGTADNYTEIELEVLTFDGASAAISDNWIAFAKDHFEQLVDDTNFVKVVVKPVPTPGSKIYDLIEVGEYELALSVISGSTLDASSFLEVFITDNRSGFLLNWGYDSSVPEIEVRWREVEGGEERLELFSFDAIVELLNGKVYLKDGHKISEYGSVDSLIEIYRDQRSLTEVSRSEELGASILPVFVGEVETEDEDAEVIPVYVVLKDKDDKEQTLLFVIVKTGNIFELNKVVEVSFELSEQAVLDAATADLTNPTKTAVSADDLAAHAEWYGWDLEVFDSAKGYVFETADSRLLVVVGKAGDAFVLVGSEVILLSEQEALDLATKGLENPTKTAVSAEDLAELVAWFEWDLEAYDSHTAYFFDTEDGRLLVIVGKAGTLFEIVAAEDLVVATEEAIAAAVKNAVKVGGGGKYECHNPRLVSAEDLLNATYLIKTYGADSTAALAALLGVEAHWVFVYEFDLDTEGTQRANGDKYVLIVVVAGHVVYDYWL
ncbi:MAG: ABC transporter substrate-binding protein [Acholeplasmataceae bacterium]|jgi:ABC-type oligopeptide transport system substrate-binding subunit